MKKEITLVSNAIKSAYNNLINIEQISKNQLEISLPVFLNNGDAFELIIEFSSDNKTAFFKNKLYSGMEESLKSYISFYDFRRKYLLNEKKYKEIQKEFLKNQKIDLSLEQTKKISISNDEKFRDELFNYVFSITRYYNFIYDSFITKPKLDEISKGNLFKNEIQNFVKCYNEKKDIKDKLLLLEKDDSIRSENNTYYMSAKEILTGVYDKVHFWESINDLENICKKFSTKENTITKITLLFDKNGLSKSYIEKMIETKEEILSILNIKDIKEKNYELF